MKYDLNYPYFILTLSMIQPVHLAAKREMAGWSIRKRLMTSIALSVDNLSTLRKSGRLLR
jgi:hypothetical protein